MAFRSSCARWGAKRRLSLRRERDHTIGRRRGRDRLGANGVVAIRSSTSMVMAGAAELLAGGTAVVLDDLPQA